MDKKINIKKLVISLYQTDPSIKDWDSINAKLLNPSKTITTDFDYQKLKHISDSHNIRNLDIENVILNDDNAKLIKKSNSNKNM